MSRQAIELTSGTTRLPALVDYLAAHPQSLNDFEYVSIHGPGEKPTRGWEEELRLLSGLSSAAQTIVVHADVLDSEAVEVLRLHGSRIAIENMEPGRSWGTSVREMEYVFRLLPEAGLVLDIAHAHAIDPSGGLTREMGEVFSDRLAHLHCSVLRYGVGDHYQPQESDLPWLARDLKGLPAVPRIWEELPIVA